MEILVIGTGSHLHECQQKFGESHHYRLAESYSQAKNLLQSGTIIFDFLVTDQGPVKFYRSFSGIVFLDSSKFSLRQMLNETETVTVFFGFCGLPTFLNRETVELSVAEKKNKGKLEDVCGKLNTKFALVKDQVGLITARVICMIINEAYFAIQENIASRSDIDLAMELGTNYPFGPFEWCERIGIKNVYELLKAVHESTKDDRYQVCELLKDEASRVTQSR